MSKAFFWISWSLSCGVLCLTPAFSQSVGAYANISICDVPGTNQAITQGIHIAGEEGAESPHTHTKITVGGVMRTFTLAGRFDLDFGAVNLDSCSGSTTEINGEAACSTTGSGSCSNKFSTKSIPTHTPENGADNQGFDISACVSSDCIGDEGCNPFSGVCY